MDYQHRGHRGSQRGTEDVCPGLSGKIIGCALYVHSTLGAGLLEAIYEERLCHEFTHNGLAFERQVHVPLRYRDLNLANGLRLDLLVENTAVVEVKAVERILSVHEAQLLTYLRLTGKRLGLLLNFNVSHLRQGIYRRVL